MVGFLSKGLIPFIPYVWLMGTTILKVGWVLKATDAAEKQARMGGNLLGANAHRQSSSTKYACYCHWPAADQ